jgi:hypothetical protein
MTSLMMHVDRDALEDSERLNNFEEYAKRRTLSHASHIHAKESFELLELHHVFDDLPVHLHTELSKEL